MKSCFGYTRVSTAKQGEGVSLEAQREAITAYAERNQLAITQWFEEKETAAKSGRPIFTNMIKALRKSKAEGLIMHKIDRSARNFADWAKIGDLSDAGIEVCFATETLDFSSRGGRLSADIQAVIAADYIRNLREETIKGINGRLKQGLYPFKAPIGYLDNGGGKPKTPDPVKAPLITQAFELYASGQYSFRSLRTKLDQMGLRNSQGGPISKHGLETFLGNPFYCGLIRIRRTGAVHKGIHEPIITVNLFENVQQVRLGKSGKKTTKHNHTYRGLFRCGHCNAAMTPELQKARVYYRCQTRECPTKTVREDSIEQSVKTTLSRVRLKEADVASLAKVFSEWCAARVEEDEGKTIALQISNTAHKLESLTDALIDRLIDQEVYNQRKQKLLMEQNRLEEEAEKAAQKRCDLNRIQKFLELIKNLAVTYIFANPAEKRELLISTTSNRIVSGKNVYLEPADWLIRTETALSGLFGDPYRPTSRTLPKLRNQQLETLIELSQSEAIAEIELRISSK